MFHRHWVKTRARVLDARIREIYHPKTGSGTISGSITLHSYVVEFQAPDGRTTRLEVEQDIGTIDVAVGSEVPLLVSPEGTKAVFDTKDPTINVVAVDQANTRADEERFRAELDGR